MDADLSALPITTIVTAARPGPSDRRDRCHPDRPGFVLSDPRPTGDRDTGTIASIGVIPVTPIVLGSSENGDRARRMGAP